VLFISEMADDVSKPAAKAAAEQIASMMADNVFMEFSSRNFRSAGNYPALGNLVLLAFKILDFGAFVLGRSRHSEAYCVERIAFLIEVVESFGFISGNCGDVFFETL